MPVFTNIDVIRAFVYSMSFSHFFVPKESAVVTGLFAIITAAVSPCLRAWTCFFYRQKIGHIVVCDIFGLSVRVGTGMAMYGLKQQWTRAMVK